MELKSAIARATRGLREDARLHAVAFFSLTIAFLCLGASLVAMANLGAVADTWGRSARMTVFLRDGAEARSIEELRLATSGLAEVEAVTEVSAADARAQFAADSDLGAALAALPVEAFPASLEIRLAAGTRSARIEEIAERIARFGAVEEVETYRGWFSRLEGLLAMGRTSAGIIALLVVLSVIFVVANTIRLSVAGRQGEIEVMKLCGATNRFVRGPFLLEGAAQGFFAALLAVVVLLVAFFALRDSVDGVIGAVAGVRAVFLPPLTLLALVLGGGLLGATGSALSLRRYLMV